MLEHATNPSRQPKNLTGCMATDRKMGTRPCVAGQQCIRSGGHKLSMLAARPTSAPSFQVLLCAIWCNDGPSTLKEFTTRDSAQQISAALRVLQPEAFATQYSHTANSWLSTVSFLRSI